MTPCENFHHQIKKLFSKIKFFWSPTAEQLSKFSSGFWFKIFTWDPKVQFKDRNDLDKKSVWNFCFWWIKHALQFLSLKNQKVSETSFFNFKIFRWFRELSFCLIFFSSNLRVGKRTRESLFLLHRSTKLKHTDSIFVPSFFFCLLGEKEFHGSTSSVKAGHFIQIFSIIFFKFFSATFVTFWIGIIF